MPDGNKIPPREIFPSPSEFGFNGWYYMSNPESKKMAYKQYHKLIHKLGQVIPDDKSSSGEKGTMTSLDEEEEDEEEQNRFTMLHIQTSDRPPLWLLLVSKRMFLNRYSLPRLAVASGFPYLQAGR